MTDFSELNSKKLPELRTIAEALGISGTENMKKNELISAITGEPIQPESDSSSDDKPKRKRLTNQDKTEKKQEDLFAENSLESEKKTEQKNIDNRPKRTQEDRPKKHYQKDKPKPPVDLPAEFASADDQDDMPDPVIPVEPDDLPSVSVATIEDELPNVIQ